MLRQSAIAYVEVAVSASRTRALRAAGAVCVALSFTLATPAEAQEWSFHGVVAAGEQLDAVAGPANKIHLLTSGYHQIDKDGTVVVSESQGEAAQTYLWAFMFPPALAVGPDGTVHSVVREGGGFDGWLDLRYRRRDPNGSWTDGYTYSSPTKWNWNVGVVDDGAGHVHLLASDHGGGGSVWADLQIYTAGSGSASNVGSLGDVYRVDYEARLRGRAGRLYLATSNAFTSSSAYFSHATSGADVVSQLGANLQSLNAGSGSEKGFPDLAIDGAGNVHYGRRRGLRCRLASRRRRSDATHAGRGGRCGGRERSRRVSSGGGQRLCLRNARSHSSPRSRGAGCVACGAALPAASGRDFVTGSEEVQTIRSAVA